MSGEMMKSASELIKPHLPETEGSGEKLGKVLIATVEGDIHDIGKNIVTMMMEISGCDVKDITLATESLGISSCIMTSAGYLFTSANGKKMKKELGFPKGYEHICTISLG